MNRCTSDTSEYLADALKMDGSSSTTEVLATTSAATGTGTGMGSSSHSHSTASVSRASRSSNMRLPTRKPSVGDLSSLMTPASTCAFPVPSTQSDHSKPSQPSCSNTDKKQRSKHSTMAKPSSSDLSANDSGTVIMMSHSNSNKDKVIPRESLHKQGSSSSVTATTTMTDKSSIAPHEPTTEEEELPEEPCATCNTDTSARIRKSSNHSRRSGNQATIQRIPPRDRKQSHWHPIKKKKRTSETRTCTSTQPGVIAIQPTTDANSGIPARASSSSSSMSQKQKKSKSHNPLLSDKTILLTKQRIRSFMTDYYEDFDSIFQNGSSKQVKKTCFEAFFDQYYTQDVLWIRSSGNPIGRKDLAGMLCDDIDIDHAILVSIDSINLLAGGMAAAVIYTADLKFSFKGQPQSDRTVLSSVLQVTDDIEIRIAHVHWSVGGPIPKESRWETGK